MHTFNKSLLAVALAVGCFSCSPTTTSQKDTSENDSMVETTMKHEPQKASLTGNWVYDEAPDEPMTVEKAGDKLRIEWVAVIDRDIEVSGELAPNDKGGFTGTVDYLLGDSEGKAPATVAMGAGPDQMDFTFEVMFEGPVPFTRQKALTCEEAAIKALERSNSYQQLMAENEVEGILAEESEQGFELQVYALSEADEVLTLGRFMADVKGQQLQQYNVVEGDYAPVDEGGLFDGLNCE